MGAGFVVTAFSLWQMTFFTADVSFATLVTTGMIQGFGLGLIFVPLSTLTFATLDPIYRTDATSMYSLMRNIGSSIGISLVIFLLTRNTQLVHAELAGLVTPFNDPLAAVAPQRIWDVTTLAGKAALNAEVTKQATVIAYADDFKLMMLVAIVALPLLLLLRKAQAKPGEHAMLE